RATGRRKDRTMGHELIVFALCMTGALGQTIPITRVVKGVTIRELPDVYVYEQIIPIRYEFNIPEVNLDIKSEECTNNYCSVQRQMFKDLEQTLVIVPEVNHMPKGQTRTTRDSDGSDGLGFSAVA